MRVSRMGRYFLRNKDSCGVGASLLDGIGDICEDGEVEMSLASLLWVCPSNNLCACEQDV